METKEIRRLNLDILLSRYPSKRVFADKMDINPAHVSQLASGYREMGHAIARRIEENEGLPVGYMDKFHSAEQANEIAEARENYSVGLNKSAVKDAITVIKFIENKTRSQMSIDEWTELFNHFYHKYDVGYKSGTEIDKAELVMDYPTIISNIKNNKSPATEK